MCHHTLLLSSLTYKTDNISDSPSIFLSFFLSFIYFVVLEIKASASHMPGQLFYH
jgi:hypothetical protein